MKYVLMILCASLFSVLAAAAATDQGYTPPPSGGNTASDANGRAPNGAPCCTCDPTACATTGGTLTTCAKGMSCPGAITTAGAGNPVIPTQQQRKAQ